MDWFFWFWVGFIDSLLVLWFFKWVKTSIVDEIKKQVDLKVIEISDGEVIVVQNVQTNKKVPRKIKSITGTIDSILLNLEKEKVF